MSKVNYYIKCSSDFFINYVFLFAYSVLYIYKTIYRFLIQYVIPLYWLLLSKKTGIRFALKI